MRIRTRELINRLTAAGIGFALAGTVFQIAVVHSHDATILSQAGDSGHYELSAKMQQTRPMVRSTPTTLLPDELDY
jgi:hypothetical protein